MNFSLLKSRTFWTVFATVVVTDGNLVAPFLSGTGQDLVVAFLGFLTVYFHINPSQTYNPPTQG